MSTSPETPLSEFPILFLGQEDALPLPGKSTLESSGSSGGGGGGLGPGTGGGASSSQIWMLPLIAIVVMVLLMSMTGRRDKKKREALLNGLKKHDRVQTIGGVIGSVVEIKPDTVVLKVDESSNTRMTFARSAIQAILKESSAPAT